MRPRPKRYSINLDRGPHLCGERVDVVAVKILLQHTPLDIYSIYNPSTAHLNLGELFAFATTQY